MPEDRPRPILCGLCRVPAERGGRADGRLVVTCPRCRREDFETDATRLAAQHAFQDSAGDPIDGQPTDTNVFNIRLKNERGGRPRWYFLDP